MCRSMVKARFVCSSDVFLLARAVVVLPSHRREKKIINPSHCLLRLRRPLSSSLTPGLPVPANCIIPRCGISSTLSFFSMSAYGSSYGYEHGRSGVGAGEKKNKKKLQCCQSQSRDNSLRSPVLPWVVTCIGSFKCTYVRPLRKWSCIIYCIPFCGMHQAVILRPSS